MSSGLRQDELRALREESRRQGRTAAGRGPLNSVHPPDDLRPLSGLPMPRGLSRDVLTTSEICAVSEAWLAGYRAGMADREACGEGESEGLTLWWSPAVPGGWPEGWRYHDSASPGARVSGPIIGKGLTASSGAAEVQQAAAEGGAPSRPGADWSAATVEGEPET